MTDHAHDEVYIGKVKFGGDLVSDARPPEHAVFVIAECGSSWRFGDDHLANAYRMIEAAKECGADAVKFQWCSDSAALASRRGEPQYAEAYKYVEYDREWLTLLKAKADAVGIEWMCTVFLPQDVSVIAPLVKRFKVAAKEALDGELSLAVLDAAGTDKKIYVSVSEVTKHDYTGDYYVDGEQVFTLHCVSKYPTPIDEIGLRNGIKATCGCCGRYNFLGLSDHTGHVLTGAVAVGAGARVIEVHFRLGPRDGSDRGTDWRNATPGSNPDFPHSHTEQSLKEYVQNIRTAERMM